MRLPIFTSFILIVILTNIAIHRNDAKIKKNDDDFWDKELKANGTRRKSLDSLNYIQIPFNRLPFGAMKDNDEVVFCENTITRLSEQKIVNLTGITNTDLKLQYGAPNINLLTTYDQNYTTLVTHLQKWADLLYNASLFEEAATVLEYAVSTRTDVTATYKLLCDLYKNKLPIDKTASEKKIRALLPVAESLNSLSKANIISIIQAALEEAPANEQFA